MRRRQLLAGAGSLLVPLGGRVALAQPVPPSPYGGSNGPPLMVNGRLVPRDLVFRFMPVTLPLTSIRVTSLYGLRSDPLRGFSALHAGVDFGAAIGTPVFSTAAGVVQRVGEGGGYGLMVEVQHGLGFSTVYGHLSAVHVAPGQMVDRNTLLGLTGNSGRSTGPHLHYEIRHDGGAIDPIGFILKMYELYHHLR